MTAWPPPLAFEHPLALLLILPLAWAAVRFTGPDRVTRARGARLALRLGFALVATLGIAGLTVGAPARPVRIELVDVSASFRGRGLAAGAALPADTRRLQFAEFTGPATPPDGTDIADAIRIALASGATEVVLRSDGRATVPGSIDAAEEAARRRVPIHVVLPRPREGSSLAITSVVAPERVPLGAPIPIEVTVAWSGPGPYAGTLVLDGVRTPVRLRPGQRSAVRLTIPVQIEDPEPWVPAIGLRELRLSLDPHPPEDLFPEDEQARPAVLVEPPQRILAVGAVPEILLPPGAPAQRIAATSFPSEPASLAGYAAIVLGDVPAPDLGTGGGPAIRDFVASGGGLLVLGARHAFASGDYSGTALERALPVLSDPGRQGGRLAVAIVVDESGSMREMGPEGRSKFDAALKALETALERLEAGDLVEVTFFARDARVVRPLGPRGAAGSVLAALPPARGGETDLFPALHVAIENVAAAPAERRHVLLISDGRSEATPDPDAALRALPRPPEVTITVVAVGGNADRPLLQKIVGPGNTVVEALAASDVLGALERHIDPRRPREAVVEGPLRVEGGRPVSHATRVRAKKDATVAMAVPEVGPLLAEAPYGGGRAVAYMSADVDPNADALRDALRRLSTRPPPAGFTLALVPEGRRLRIEATAPRPETLSARVGEVEVPLEEVAPRLYVARVDRPRRPALAALLRPAASGAAPLATAIHAPARPLEHEPGADDEVVLRAIAATSGGRVLAPGEPIPEPVAPATGGRRSAMVPLAAGSIALVLLDLLVEALALTSRRKPLK